MKSRPSQRGVLKNANSWPRDCFNTVIGEMSLQLFGRVDDRNDRAVVGSIKTLQSIQEAYGRASERYRMMNVKDSIHSALGVIRIHLIVRRQK
jgi:hypothetical protein